MPKENKRLSGVQVEVRTSNMRYDLARLVAEEAMTLEDSSEFTPELQEAVRPDIANMNPYHWEA